MPRTVAFSLACLLVAAPQLAHAADPLCLPSVDPGPNWWTPSRKGPDWSGAVKRGVVTEQTRATLRSVWTPGRDVASFEVRVAHDPSIDPDHDAVIVMVSDASGTVPELYIRFSPLLDCVTPGSCTGAGAPLAADAIEYAEASMGISLSWSSVSPDNPDLDIVVTHPWVSLVPADGDHTWTLQFALSLPTTGGAIDGDRRIFVDALAWDPGVTSGTWYEHPLTCTSSSLITNDCALPLGISYTLPFDVGFGALAQTWSELSVGQLCGP